MRRRWRDPEYRAKMLAARRGSIKRLWQDSEFRAKVSAAIRKAAERLDPFVLAWFAEASHRPDPTDLDELLRHDPFSRFYERLYEDEEEWLDSLERGDDGLRRDGSRL